MLNFSVARLDALIRAAGVAIDGISVGQIGNSASVTVSPPSQQAAAQPTINAFDWSQAAQDVFDNSEARSRAQTLIDTDKGDLLKLLRAVAAVLVDETNLHALKINAILSAIDAGSSLAQVKTNIAAIPDYPQRTLAQMTSAIKDKIAAGTVD